jgi:type II secretory pathway predicted ATPase ExeA
MSFEAPWTPKAVDRPVALPHARPGWLTYETFYGLKEKPFSLASDPSFFYNSSSHAAAFDDLLSGIRRRESLAVLSGDIGTGKTTLCRTVLQNLDRQTFSAFVPDPFATREDLLKVVLVDFGVVSAEDLASGRLRGASRTELSYLLYEFLDTLSPLQAFAVVFIDEAQNLSLPLLEEIRILSDSDGRERMLQVVLVGQLELRDKLRLPEMRQVAHRVSVHCRLEPLDCDGVDGYVAHRLHVAGGTPDRVRFSREAIDAVYDASHGVPRLINRVCDRALHHGQQRRVAVIDRSTVALAIAEMEPVVATRAAEPAAVADPVVVVEPVAVVEPKEPTEPKEPSAPTEPFEPSEPSTEEWFAKIDATVKKAAESDPVNIGVVHPLPIAPPPTRRSRTGAVPLTHMEMLQRVWLRRLKIAVVLLVILGGAGLGLSIAVNILVAQPVTSPSVASPAPPVLPTPLSIPDPPDDPAPAAADTTPATS